MSMWLLADLRDPNDYMTASRTITVALEVHHVWWAGVTLPDLHIQFVDSRDYNILPYENKLNDEFYFPREARTFWSWFHLVTGVKPDPERMTAKFCSIQGHRPPNHVAHIVPPDVLKNLVDHWESPNK